jgi:hypothetical protein
VHASANHGAATSPQVLRILNSPPLLCVHLKRFSFDKRAGKAGGRVAFPLEGLSLAQFDAAAKADQIRIEESRIEAQKEIAAMQVGASSAAAKDKLEKQQLIEGTRIGAEIAKNRAQMAAQSAQRAFQKPKKERD